MSKGRRLVTVDEAMPAKGQHTKPCSDCPFVRTALPGWLAGSTADEWARMAHGETKFECHTLLGAQCAGSAIYRANVCKKPRDPKILALPSDRKLVFATPVEFLAHHNTGPGNLRKK